MPKFLVRGESTVQWNLTIEDGDYQAATDKARRFIEDNFMAELAVNEGDGLLEGVVVGQQDRVLRVREVD